MERVLKKSLLVVILAVLCFMPLFMLGGCENKTNGIDMSGYDIEIANVAYVQLIGENSTTPLEGKIWYNKTQQRIRFYARYDTYYTYTIQLYEYPYNNCKIVYNGETYNHETTN